MESTLTYLQRLTAETHKPEAEVLTLIFQVGLRELWREHILGRYLRQEISREEAIDEPAWIWSNWRSVNIRQLWRMSHGG